MAIQILLPALPTTTPPARLLRWRVAVGQQVAVGDVIAEIASGQTTIEVESTFAGRIERILVPENTWAIPPNAAIALLALEHEESPGPEHSSDDAWEPLAALQPSGGVRPPEEGQFASPRARELAHVNSIDLRSVRGSGPEGRIVSRDVEAVLADRSRYGHRGEPVRSRSPAPPPRQQISRPVEAPTAPQPERRVPERVPERLPTPDQRTPPVAAPEDDTQPSVPAQPPAARTSIASRNATDTNAREVPCARLTIDCSIDALMRWRLDRDTASSDAFVLPSATSPAVVFAKALGLALADIPAANVTWTPTGLQRHRSADVAFAVLVPELQVTPVLRKVDTRSLDDIAQSIIDLTRRAQEGSLDPRELQGGAVSILDLGAYGIRTFEPVLEPPRAISLSLGARQQRPIVVDGEIRSASIITCSLSCDIRAVPVAVAAELLATIRALVEEPNTLLSPRAAHPSF